MDPPSSGLQNKNKKIKRCNSQLEVMKKSVKYLPLNEGIPETNSKQYQLRSRILSGT
jgi:hypothetical protein